MVLLLQTYTLNWDKFLLGVMPGKTGTFHFIQKSEMKTSQPPGDFLVPRASLASFLCLTLEQTDFLLYAQPVRSLPGERGEKPPWPSHCGRRRVARKPGLSSRLGGPSTGSCPFSLPHLVCSRSLPQIHPLPSLLTTGLKVSRFLFPPVLSGVGEPVRYLVVRLIQESQ